MIIKKSNNAVSTIIGTLLLLTMVLIAISTLYFYVLSDNGPTPETYVKIIGRVSGTNVILEHQGGETLDLDTKISIKIAGTEYNGLVYDWLKDQNNNNEWNLGESMIFPFEYDLKKLGEYRDVSVMAIDDEANSIVLKGPIELKPVSDAGMSITVNNPKPKIGDIIQFTITVTSYGGDVNGSGNISVKCQLPKDLIYIDSSSSTGHGPYNYETDIWTVGDVILGYPAVLQINAKVIGTEQKVPIQLATILDGSGSISGSDWQLMKDGLSAAIADKETFPSEDGMVELTIIQFGGGYYNTIPHSQVEIPPVIVTDNPDDQNGYYINIANKIKAINQLDGYTPMGCGIRLAADQLYDIGNFSRDKRQVILLVTDGKANCIWIPNTYNAYHEDYPEGKISAEEAREYLIQKINMNDKNDEFDSLAVGPGPDIAWLNSSMVWPQPGYIAPPFTKGSGWVSHVDTWEEFAERIKIIFEIIFESFTYSVELIDSTTYDPNDNNDYASLLILPE